MREERSGRSGLGGTNVESKEVVYRLLQDGFPDAAAHLRQKRIFGWANEWQGREASRGEARYGAWQGRLSQCSERERGRRISVMVLALPMLSLDFGWAFAQVLVVQL